MIVMLTCSERESTSLDQLQQYVFHTLILQTGSGSSLNHTNPNSQPKGLLKSFFSKLQPKFIGKQVNVK